MDGARKQFCPQAQHSAGIKLTVNAEDITESVDPLKIVENYKVKGGPAPTEVERALTIRKQHIALSKSNVSKIKQKIDEAEGKLQSTVKSYLLPNSLGSGRFKNLSLYVV